MKFTNTTFQAIKFLIVGGAATVVDLIGFSLLDWVVVKNQLIAKSISFLIAVAIKYLGNKYWTFQQRTNEKIPTELFSFFIITIVGLAIDVCTFYYATKIAGPQFGLSLGLWTQVSVILAALSSALISFLGYKFLVFNN